MFVFLSLCPVRVLPSLSRSLAKQCLSLSWSSVYAKPDWPTCTLGEEKKKEGKAETVRWRNRDGHEQISYRNTIFTSCLIHIGHHLHWRPTGQRVGAKKSLFWKEKEQKNRLYRKGQKLDRRSPQDLFTDTCQASTPIPAQPSLTKKNC